MLNIDKKKINNILEYLVVIVLVIISISKGGYYKRDAIIGIGIINIIYIVKIILNFKEKSKQNILNYVLLLFSLAYSLPIVFSNTATMSGSINALFKVFTGFSIFSIVQGSENKEKFKNGIIVSGIIIGLLGIDEMTFRLLDLPLKSLGSGYLDEYNGTLSSVIQYANISGIIFVISSIFILEKITKARKEMNEENNGKDISKEYIKDEIKKENYILASKVKKLLSKEYFFEIVFLFFGIVTFLTQSKMAILLFIVSTIMYKVIHKEYKDIIKIFIVCTIALLFSLENISRFKEYITTFDSTKTRIEYYKDALKLWSLSPLNVIFGQGGNVFRMLYETVQTSGYVSMEVHSLFIQVLLESGLCGLVLFLFAIIYALIKGKNTNAKLILIVVCVLAAFDVFFTYTYALFVLFMILALCDIPTKESKLWQKNVCLLYTSIITIFMVKTCLGYIIEPIEVEDANITLEEQENKIKQCEKALLFDPWDMDIREKYTKACKTYLDMMDIKNKIYAEDNIEKRKEVVSKIYINTLREVENEEHNKYAIDDYMKNTIKYLDYLVTSNYDFNVLEGYEYYLDKIMEKSEILEETHKYNDVCQIINRNNLLNVYNKYEELNYILNSDKIEKTLYIIKEKENINL